MLQFLYFISDKSAYSDKNLKFRMERVLKTVNSFGDYEKLAQGVFENYVTMKVKDSSLESICESLEWFCFSDVVNKQIYTLQNYSLMPYLQYAFVIWHFAFGTYNWNKLNYPSASYEVSALFSAYVCLLCILYSMISLILSVQCWKFNSFPTNILHMAHINPVTPIGNHEVVLVCGMQLFTLCILFYHKIEAQKS